MSFDPRVKNGAAVIAGLAVVVFFFSKAAFVLLLFVLAGHFAFFRDPMGTLPPGDGPLSPAEGTVVEIAEGEPPHFISEPCVKIGIFLSIFNVHVTRSPLAGRVNFLKYVPGKFLNALAKDSVYYNECNWIGLEAPGRKALVRQISGAIARRIHCDSGLGHEVQRASKLGIICYGSRVECWIPKRLFRPCVAVGQKVKAGQTLLGEWQP